jgi:hypothetical protein
MTSKIRPLIEINQQATSILIREMGVVDTIRFLGQFQTGAGDYTKDHDQWLDELSLDEITEEIKANRRCRTSETVAAAPCIFRQRSSVG